MNLAVPAAVYEQYQQLPEDQLVAEVRRLMESPKSASRRVDMEFREWLIALSVYTLRPTITGPESGIEAAKWVAFAVRHLIPLCNHADSLIAGQETLKIIQDRPKLVWALLLSTPEKCVEYLSRDYKAPIADDFSDPHDVVTVVQYSTSSSRTIYKRVESVMERLQMLVVKAFLDVSKGRSHFTAPVVSLNSRPQDLSYLAVLEWYAEREPALRLLALRELEVFKAQVEHGNRYVNRIPVIGGFTLLVVLSSAVMVSLGETLYLALMVGSIILLMVYIGLTTAYMSHIYTSVRAVIRAFDKHLENENF